MSTSKAEIAELVNECYPDEEIVLFDGLEEAFLGIATRSEPIMTMDTEERRMVPSGVLVKPVFQPSFFNSSMIFRSVSVASFILAIKLTFETDLYQ